MRVARLCWVASAGSALADDPAAAQHHDAVGDGEHLAELVGDEDDRLALVDQAAHDAEEVVDLARGEHRGGLVEDEDVGLAEQRLDQLDPLLLADGQVADDGVGVDLEAVAARRARGSRSRAVSRSSSGPLRGSSPRMTFSATVKTGMSWKCWCTMPMPAAMASAELANSTGSPRRQDLAGVGLVEPEHDVHQRALARAVLAEQAEDLALAGASRSTSSLAMTPGKVLVTPRTSRIGASVPSLMPLPRAVAAESGGSGAARPPSAWCS